MDFYLNLLKKKERTTDDAPSIGIILRSEKDSLAVEFALKNKTHPIGVAEYQLQGAFPGAAARQTADRSHAGWSREISAPVCTSCLRRSC